MVSRTVAPAARRTSGECGEGSVVSQATISPWAGLQSNFLDSRDAAEQLRIFDLSARAAQTLYRWAAHYLPTATARDSLAIALMEVRDDLARYPLFKALGREWAEALCGTIDGMAQEYEWRLRYRNDSTETLPSYEQYLIPGRYSVGGP